VTEIQEAAAGSGTGRVARALLVRALAGGILAGISACGDDPPAGPDPIIVDVLPRIREGTPAELGPVVGVRLNFFAVPPPAGEEHARLERVVSFELDGREYVGRIDGPRIEAELGTPFTLVVVEPDLEAGPHAARVSVLDTAGEVHRVWWTFSLLDEERAPYDDLEDVASFVTVFPPPDGRGPWSRIGPRVGFRASNAGESFILVAFNIETTSYLNDLLCVEVLPLVVECSVELQPELPGDYLVLLSFRRSGDPDRIHRVRWFFNVQPDGLPGSAAETSGSGP
jgi:hypothetical protein